MTGFAEKNFRLAWHGESIPCSISIKAVNSRFLELNCKVPPFLSSIEVTCIKLCKQLLKRGSVTIIVLMGSNTPGASITARTSVACNYIDACRALQKKFGLSGDFTVSDLFRIPDLFMLELDAADSSVHEQCATAIESLLHEVRTMRTHEGQAMHSDIIERIAHIQERLQTIETAAIHVLATRKELVAKKIQELESSSPELVSAQRNAWYMELDKADLHEEIMRFGQHVHALRTHLNSDEEEKGRKLDFIVQEMNREINTVGAKCNDSTISAQVIDVKVELEKIRELIQNIV